jgi:hypothetical protein
MMSIVRVEKLEVPKLIPTISFNKFMCKSIFLKALFIPVLFALTTYAVAYDDVHKLRTVLDPLMTKVAGVDSSMVGGCVKGTDKDPFADTKSSPKERSMDLCLVYFVKDESVIPYVRSQYKKMKVASTVQVRFQKSFAAMVEK